MLTQIDVVHGDGLETQALALPIIGVSTKDSLIIRKVTGLSPSEMNLFIGEYSRDGGEYQGRRAGLRNVVMTIDINPNPALGETVSDLREMLYRIFLDPQVDSDHVQLVLHDEDGPKRSLFGYAETTESEIFDQETLFQVSLLCPDPYIRDLVETVLTNPNGTWVTVPFSYGGTAETGFEAEIFMSDPSPRLTIQNNAKTMIFDHQFYAGDVVRLNTNPGELHAEYTRDSVVYPLIGKLHAESPWLTLKSRTNAMSVYGLTPSETVAGVKTLKFRAAYWGM